MGMIGILLLITAASQPGLTGVGVAAGFAGVALFGLGFRLGFCPACTIARLMEGRRT